MATAAGPARLIGEVVVEPDPSLGLPTLTGFENHGGRTTLGPRRTPLGQVLSGGGNGVDDGDGVLRDRIVGTYLHGPGAAPQPGARRPAARLGRRRRARAARRPSSSSSSARERLDAASATGWRARLRDLRLNRG